MFILFSFWSATEFVLFIQNDDEAAHRFPNKMGSGPADDGGEGRMGRPRLECPKIRI